jgi:hypothetical protein
MRVRLPIPLCALVALLAGSNGAALGQQPAAPGQEQQAPASAAPLTALVDQLAGFFPSLDAEVIEVRGEEITIDAGRGNGVQAGLEVEAYRAGREIKHPKTGQVLGRTEDALGRARVTDAQERLSLARAPAGHSIRVGDRVRVSSSRVNLVLVPLQGGLRENLVELATQDLVERLSASGRFRVTMGDSVNVLLAQQGIKPEEFLEGKGVAEAFQRLKADNILAVHYRRVQGRPYMDVRFFWAGQPAAMAQSAFFVPASIRSQAQTARFSQGGPNAPQQVRTRSLLERLLGLNFDGDSYSAGEPSLPLREVARFSFPVLALDVAVQPKDKIPRLVASDGDQVYMYRIVDQNFQIEWTRSVRSLGRVFSLQLADLDADGVLEVIANRYDPKLGLNNFILGAKDGKPRFLIEHVPDFLFAVDTTGQGVKQTLWSQRYNPQEFYTLGQAEQVSFKNGKLVTDKRVRVPQSFRPMGAAFSNITGKGSWSLAYVDAHNRLQISNEAEELWRSGTPVGGGYAVVEQVIDSTERGGRSRFHKIEPTPLAVDLDNDGIDELVVPQNIVREGLMAVIFKGPAGYRLQSVESGFAGGITALGSYRTEEAAHPTLIVAVVRFNNLLRTAGATQIIMTVPQE